MERARVDPMALVYHELRAPLGLVATAARSMAEDMPDEELRSRCEVIVRAAERMLRTAEAVTSITAGLSGDDDGSESYSPIEILSDLVETLRGLDVPLEFCADTPTTPAVAGSGARFEALVHSLITNAMDHGDPASPVRLAVGRSPGRVTVEVRNSLSERDTHRGGGLGMIIANALARGLGATLTARAAEGEYVARIGLAVQQQRRPYSGATSRASA